MKRGGAVVTLGHYASPKAAALARARATQAAGVRGAWLREHAGSTSTSTGCARTLTLADSCLLTARACMCC